MRSITAQRSHQITEFPILVNTLTAAIVLETATLDYFVFVLPHLLFT